MIDDVVADWAVSSSGDDISVIFIIMSSLVDDMATKLVSVSSLRNPNKNLSN